jgi:8-oxo-dGTP diphosphatase
MPYAACLLFRNGKPLVNHWQNTGMKSPDKIRAQIMAAGGIVVRDAQDPDAHEPVIAIVRLRKDRTWVLPKGKLKSDEDALTAARREVLEETGHAVSSHEFLGTMSHAVGDKIKIVQFWRMQASAAPVRPLMRDIREMQWLPLKDAVAMLTHLHEQVFLEQVGPVAIAAAARSARPETQTAMPAVTVRPVPAAPSSIPHVAPGPLAALNPFLGTIQAWLRRVISA